MQPPDYLPLCSIAGWDPTCGAGAGADLRVFSAHGAHGAAVLSALTAQTDQGLHALTPVSGDLLHDQLAAVRTAREPRAWKVGLLPDAPTISIVAEHLARSEAPVVLDPVLAPTAGGWSLPDDGVQCLRTTLLPRTTLVTPNAEEVRRLAGLGPTADPREAARALLEQGAAAVLVTGGEGPSACDWLLREGHEDRSFDMPRVEGGPFHGTGCALSSAIVVRLAQGHALEAAIAQAKQYVHALLALSSQTDAWLLPHLAVRPT